MVLCIRSYGSHMCTSSPITSCPFVTDLYASRARVTFFILIRVVGYARCKPCQGTSLRTSQATYDFSCLYIHMCGTPVLLYSRSNDGIHSTLLSDLRSEKTKVFLFIMPSGIRFDIVTCARHEHSALHLFKVWKKCQVKCRPTQKHHNTKAKRFRANSVRYKINTVVNRLEIEAIRFERGFLSA